MSEMEIPDGEDQEGYVEWLDQKAEIALLREFLAIFESAARALLAKIAAMDADRLTPEELAAVREAGENFRHTSYTPYRELGVTLRALADRLEGVK